MSTLNKDNFDYLSDDLFGDDDEDELNITKVSSLSEDTDSQECRKSYGEQRMEEKKKLYEIYMADPTIPESQKNGKCFLKCLYSPTYRTRKVYELVKFVENLKQNTQEANVATTRPKKARRKLAVTEGFGYDSTFFAPTEVLLAEKRKLANIPKPIKEIYQNKGIVSASQIYQIERKLEGCDSDDSEKENFNVPSTSKRIQNVKKSERSVNNEISKSLLELSRTLSEQHEISQVIKDLENIDDLDASLTELTEKIQHSKKAATLIDHTISCSQRLKMLDAIYSESMENINTCDLFRDEDEAEFRKSPKKDDLRDNSKNLPIKIGRSSDINGNISKSRNGFSLSQFSFASGKDVEISNCSTSKFKNIFDENEETDLQPEESTTKNSTSQNSSQLKSLSKNQQNNKGTSNFCGFVFASGKQLNVNNSKLQTFEKKFREEEEKLEKTDIPSNNSSSQKSTKTSQSNQECAQIQRKSSRIQLQNNKTAVSSQDKNLSSQTESATLKRVRSKTLLARKPKKVHFDESTIVNEKGHASVSGVQNNFSGFVFASGKSTNISYSKIQAIEKKFMEEEAKMNDIKEQSVPKINNSLVTSDHNYSKNDENFKDSTERTSITGIQNNFKGFVFASGKSTNISSTKIQAIEKKFREEEANMKDLTEQSVPKINNSLITDHNYSKNENFIDSTERPSTSGVQNNFKGFVFASGKSTNISSSKIQAIEKKFREEEEANMNDITEQSVQQIIKTPVKEDVKKSTENATELDYFKSQISVDLTEIEEIERQILNSKKHVSSVQKENHTKNQSKRKFEEVESLSPSSDNLVVNQSSSSSKYTIDETFYESSPEKGPSTSKSIRGKSRTVFQRKPKKSKYNNFIRQNDTIKNQIKSSRNYDDFAALRETFNIKPLQNRHNNAKISDHNSAKINEHNSAKINEHKKAKLSVENGAKNTTSDESQKSAKNSQFSSIGTNLKEMHRLQQINSNSPQTSINSISKSKTNESSTRNFQFEEESQSKSPISYDFPGIHTTPKNFSAFAFVFASGKDVNISQSKLDSFKRKFEDVEEEISSELPNKSETSKIDDETVSNHEQTSSNNQSSLKIGKDSGLSFHSFRMSSRRAKQTQEEESDIFNFSRTRERSGSSLRNKRDSQANIKIGDSGIESQDKLINRVDSPKDPFVSFKATFFAPSFTSSPVVRQNKSKITTKSIVPGTSKQLSPLSSFRKNFDLDKKRKIHDIKIDEDDDDLPFKPTAVKRLALENETMISPIAGPSKKITRSKRPAYNMTQRLAEVDEFLALQSQLKLFANDPTPSQLDNILEFEQQQMSRFEDENKAKIDRKEAFKEQLDYVNNKPEDDSRQMTGTMYMMKSGYNRKNLRDYVENEKPREKNCHVLSIDEILDFKFDMKQFVDGDVSLRISVTLGDNAKIIMDEASKIGYNEIKQGFLASYGVDPKLISDEWIKNAYKMIFLKFLWMENSFERIGKFEVLTPENLLLQLKYRYDREIDRHQRSALRKMTELDEAPNRRVVLKVINIIYTLDSGYELDLSDGWYKIRTIVDSCLAEAIARKRIVENSKLLICNAELMNIFTTGYSPLELPPGVRLKIHGNSTRLVAWDRKLGFCKNPGSFLISLNAASCEGGMIGKMMLFITHVYSLVYVESNGEKKEFRSEKMQHRLENKREILFSTIYEKIEKQIVQEAYAALKERVGKIDRRTVNISNMPLTDICDILEYDIESELTYSIRRLLTKSQMEKVQDIFNQRRFELHQKIKDRIEKGENNVAQLLKFRVVDLAKPKKTALISWWQPSEELLDIIKVGNSIEILKTSSGGKFQASYSGEIQIHADRSTTVKLLKGNANFDGRYNRFIRFETKFQDVTQHFKPLNNEFDIVGMIIYVAEKQASEKFQKVYVADEKMNLMSLNFYPNLTDYAYEDVLIEGKVLYIRNLQWRKVINENMPEAHAVIDSTIFISNPRYENQKRRLEEFGSTIGDCREHLEKCREKLGSMIGNITGKPKKVDLLNVPTYEGIAPIVKPSKRVLGMRKQVKYKFS